MKLWAVLLLLSVGYTLGLVFSEKIYKHIALSIGLLISLLCFCLTFGTKLDEVIMAALIAATIAIVGYIYASGEKRKLQELRFKRKTYAKLMESLLVFSASDSEDKLAPKYKKADDKKKASQIYFRSWVETSDKVYSKFLEYFEAYIEWTKNKNEETEKLEKRKFNELTSQMKKEVNPASREKFVPYYFK